jgi:hypothetical protein
MVKLFSLLLNLGPNGSHAVKGASALPIEYKQ